MPDRIATARHSGEESSLREKVALERRTVNAYEANRCGTCKLDECSGFECLVGFRAAIAVCMEEAARVCESLPWHKHISPSHVKARGPEDYAAAIRALIPTSEAE